MDNLTPEGLSLVAEMASRHSVSVEAALALLKSLQQGNGGQAQFNHPDLGGMGQWSHGGMIMIGDMFNHDLKYRVAALCDELAGLVREPSVTTSESQSQNGAPAVSLFVPGLSPSGSWWPAEWGAPASAGAQNDLQYAYFPAPRRLAIRQGGQVRGYDTGEHIISGVSQAQGGDQTLTFSSQLGLVRLADLAPVAPRAEAEPPRPKPDAAAPEKPAPAPSVSAPNAQLAGDAIFAAIERLADLRQKKILSEEEFSEKKRELLSRL